MEPQEKPTTIDQPVQLLVEGKDPQNFFQKFIEHLERVRLFFVDCYLTHL